MPMRKYSAPDYEKILAANCGLAIENTMIYHTPEVKEQLERFGIPVLVERSSYESGPLARLEWLKFWGILLGKEELAEQEFARQVERLAPLAEQAPTGKRCAFFSITANNLANVRKGGDYVAQMIEMAGGDYVFADLTDNGNNLSTMNLPLDVDETYDVDTGYYTVHIQIKDGAARFVDSPCPDHICEGFGWLSNEDQTATCLPARAVLTIVPVS